VTDNSLEQAISSLRRLLGQPDGAAYIETQARRGYRFAAKVRRAERREPLEALDALLAPHRPWIEGCASFETLDRSQIVHARQLFERVVQQVPDQASAHIGLAGEQRGQLYARERGTPSAPCGYGRATGGGALAAFDEAIARVPLHPTAHAATAALIGAGARTMPPGSWTRR
jgi:hypothetical protein